MEDNIFNIVGQSSLPVQKSPYSDFSQDALDLDEAPSDLMVESLSQEEVIGRLHDYLTKLDKKQSSQQANAKGDIKGSVEQIERLIEELEGEETIDSSTLRHASKEAAILYEKAEKALTLATQEPEAAYKFKKTSSLRKMLAETQSASHLQHELLNAHLK